MPNCPLCFSKKALNESVCPYCTYNPAWKSFVLSVGTVLQGRYEIQEIRQMGTIESIYLVKDQKLFGRYCIAIQVNKPVESVNETECYERAVTSFSKLNISNMAIILDHFLEKQHFYIIVEYAGGKTLSQILDQSRHALQEEEVVHWALSMCETLISVHQHNRLFGDICPDKVVLTDEGFIQFNNFISFDNCYSNHMNRLIITGKFGYTPPERWHGKGDQRSDIFSLAATLYYLLTGFSPLSQEYLSSGDPSLSDYQPLYPTIRDKNGLISANLESVLSKALQLDPEQRYASVKELASDLRMLIREAPILNSSCEHIEFHCVRPGEVKTTELMVSNEGTGKLRGNVNSDKPWLTASPDSLNPDLDVHNISVVANTKGLSRGFSEIGNIRLITNGGRKTITVKLIIGDTAARAILTQHSHRFWFFLITPVLLALIAFSVIILNMQPATAPIPLKTTVLIEDNLSNPTGGWIVASDRFMDSQYINNEYCLIVKGGNYIITGRTNPQIGVLSDFILEVNARFNAGPDNTWYGVGLRRAGTGNSYDILLDSGSQTGKSSYAIFKQVAGECKVIKDWTNSPHIKTLNNTNKLKITCRGSEFNISVNDQSVFQFNDAAFPSGTIALEAAKAEGESAYIYFSNLKLSLIN
jgi:serine/threonine-protein kinase